MDDDPLLNRLTTGQRRLLADMIEGSEREGGGLIIYDWLTGADGDQPLVESLADFVRLYAPDPRLGLCTEEVVDEKMLGMEIVEHPLWPYRYADDGEFLNRLVKLAKMAPGDASLDWFRTILRKYTRRREVLRSPLAEAVLARFVRAAGDEESARQVEQLANGDPKKPALLPTISEWISARFPNNTGVVLKGHNVYGINYIHMICQCQNVFRPRFTPPETTVVRTPENIVECNSAVFRLPWRREPLELWIGECSSCRKVYWWGRADEPLAQADRRYQVLSLPVFEQMRWGIKRHISDLYLFSARDERQAVDEVYRVVNRDFLKPWRRGAEIHARHDTWNKCVVIEQELRPIDFLPSLVEEGVRAERYSGTDSNLYQFMQTLGRR
jgi:hypothetical protein